MQKISTYLYPNRINVVADLALFPVRWNIVYQNNIKIYKGVDNLLTIDVKNAEQKRINIASYNLRLAIFDVNGQEIITVPISPSGTTGLATALVTAQMITNAKPQFLKYSIYNQNLDNSKNIFYSDANFGAIGNIEIVANALPTSVPERIISRFLVATNDQTTPFTPIYNSDAVEIKKPNYINLETTDTINFEFLLNQLDSTITVQFTEDTVVSATSTWTNIETFSVNSTTNSINKTYNYPVYNRNYAWARVQYTTEDNNTGKIDKVIVRL